MTVKELFENLEKTEKKADYLESILGFPVVFLETIMKYSGTETKKKYKKDEEAIESIENFDYYEKKYILIFAGWLEAIWFEHTSGIIYVYQYQYRLNSEDKVALFEDDCKKFKIVEEFKEFLKGILK